jgi:FtsZ-interacting cell division protein ZipA
MPVRRMRCNGCARACDNYSKEQQNAAANERLCTDCEGGASGNQRPAPISAPPSPPRQQSQPQQQQQQQQTPSSQQVTPADPRAPPHDRVDPFDQAARQQQQQRQPQQQQQQANADADFDAEEIERDFIGSYTADADGEPMKIELKDKNQSYVTPDLVDFFGVWYV